MHRAVVVAGMVLTFVLATATTSQGAVTTNVREPFTLFEFIPCANGGAGESIELTGTLHILFTATENGSGGFSVSSHFNPQALTGVGDTTGAKYQGTGVTRDNFNLNVGQVSTFVNNFRMIGQGPGNNLLVHDVTHVTVNAKGVVTAEVFKSSFECR
jgi:hypothetical protein